MTLPRTRREILIGAAGVMTMSSMSFASPIKTPNAQFLYEPAADWSGRWFNQARQSGWTLVLIEGDIWQIAERLDNSWIRRPTSLSGITTSATFFILEQLACRRGLRLKQRDGASWVFDAPA